MKKLAQHFNGNELSEDDAAKLQEIATDLRRRLIEYSSRTKTPHLASGLSCLDILTCYYFNVLNFDVAQPTWAQRDKFLLSKGHAAPALFHALAFAGFFSRADLKKQHMMAMTSLVNTHQRHTSFQV